MFWNLFKFRGYSERELASVIWNDEQGDLFYYADPHRNWCQPQPTQEKLGRGFGKNVGEWAERVEISSRKQYLAVDETCVAIYILTYSRLLFSTDGPVISASAGPPLRGKPRQESHSVSSLTFICPSQQRTS